jgi:PAS domain-containing protein
MPGTTLPQILEARIAPGCAPEDSQKYVTDRMAEAFRPDPGYMVNQLKDGRTLAVSRRPMPDGGPVAVHQDITAHLHAEKELEKTKQFLNSIIENIPIAVVVKDANTRKFVLVNRRAKDAERIDASDNEALANELGAYSPDYEIEMPHGDTRILATNRIVASDSQGVARHLIVVMDDVTEKKSPSSVSHLWPTTMF